MTDTFFPTSTPAMNEELSLQINTLQREVERLTNNRDHYQRTYVDMEQRIRNVKGYISDIYSMEGEISEEIKEIASILRIELTKTVNVSVTVTFSGTANIPMDMDEDDIQNDVSFSFDEGYSDIEWDIEESDQDWDIQEV